jgi:hypothetical protein
VFKNTEIEIYLYRTVTLLGALHGYEIWYVTLSEEHRLTLFNNWVVRKISGAKREEGQETRENYILDSLIDCIAHHMCQ